MTTLEPVRAVSRRRSMSPALESFVRTAHRATCAAANFPFAFIFNRSRFSTAQIDN